MKKRGELPRPKYTVGRMMNEQQKDWEENRLERERIHKAEIEKQKTVFLKNQLEELIILK